MSEQKESSVLFSLQELMNLEQDRIQSEEAEKAQKIQAAETARIEAERSARDAEEQRIRAEAERRRLDEQRSREEAAKLEAIRVAEVEKARVEAEQRARLEAMAAQQHHERSMAAIQTDASKKKLRNMLIGGVVFVVLAGSGLGYFVYTSAEENRARIAAQQADSARLEEEKKKLESQMREQTAKVDGLLSQLASAKDEATRAKLQKELEEERLKQESLKTGGARVGGPGPVKTGPAKSKCTPGDPLCSDL